jgi:hypothetical protein
MKELQLKKLKTTGYPLIATCNPLPASRRPYRSSRPYGKDDGVHGTPEKSAHRRQRVAGSVVSDQRAAGSFQSQL